MDAALGAEGIVVATGSFCDLAPLALADLLDVQSGTSSRLSTGRPFTIAWPSLRRLSAFSFFRAELTPTSLPQFRLRWTWNSRLRRPQGYWLQGLHHRTWRGDLTPLAFRILDGFGWWCCSSRSLCVSPLSLRFFVIEYVFLRRSPCRSLALAINQRGLSLSVDSEVSDERWTKTRCCSLHTPRMTSTR